MSSPALSRHRVRPAAGRQTSGAAVPSPTASYRYDSVAGSWWWSPGMHDLLGLDPLREPGTESFLAVHHPGDAPRVIEAVTSACDSGRPFALETRVLHPTRAQRSVVLTGEPVRDATGAVCGVEGQVSDITGSRAQGADAVRALEAEVAQMRTAMASRAVIEQAKGVLMLLTNCGEQAAFDLLAHISSHTHRKVRDVAQLLTGSAAGRTRLPDDLGAILRDACPPGQPVG
ncbi:hypothetical protein DQ244_01430 [Blastococcus sp. TBT05-19]|uniref:PAS and ANTAR domain-containing protein n=1 Tax=Blastococcus sp. TBT05-19 TaxID=2250581 RepID=UPI000DE86786|nr:PAS and ANTAR domain-containing protein [Blastococcus sp. TBT05-19]RBY94055.1 hypothetical protein DQ244_01430 [Blastococcus sp. TBT05-19]